MSSKFLFARTFEVYFSNDLKEGVEVITNIYHEGKSIFAYGGSIEVVFSRILSKVSLRDEQTAPTNFAHALSESPFTEIAF